MVTPVILSITYTVNLFSLSIPFTYTEMVSNIVGTYSGWHRYWGLTRSGWHQEKEKGKIRLTLPITLVWNTHPLLGRLRLFSLVCFGAGGASISRSLWNPPLLPPLVAITFLEGEQQEKRVLLQRKVANPKGDSSHTPPPSKGITHSTHLENWLFFLSLRHHFIAVRNMDDHPWERVWNNNNNTYSDTSILFQLSL